MNEANRDACPRCGGRLRAWRELGEEEREVVRRLPASAEQATEERAEREFQAVQASPFFQIWACAAVDEIVSALHRRLLLGAV